MGIASMILGIVGLLFSFVPCLGMYALPVTGLALILGVLAMRAPKDGSVPKGKGMAIAGLVTGLIGSLIAAYWLWAWMHVTKGEGLGGLGKEFQKGFEKGLRDEAEKRHHDMTITPDKPDPEKAPEADKPEAEKPEAEKPAP